MIAQVDADAGACTVVPPNDASTSPSDITVVARVGGLEAKIQIPVSSDLKHSPMNVTRRSVSFGSE